MDYIAEAGFDQVYGARPLKRALDENIEDLLADLILADKVSGGSKVFFDVDDKKVVYKIEK